MLPKILAGSIELKSKAVSTTKVLLLEDAVLPVAQAPAEIATITAAGKNQAFVARITNFLQDAGLGRSRRRVDL